MTELTVLNGAAIQSLLTIPMAVRAVEQAYLEKSTGGAALWPMVFHEFTPGAADLDIKSGHMNGLGLYGMKVVSWFGDNPAKDLPALYGTSLLFDIHTGAPRALLNAGPITDFRTGAAGAVGAKYLARPDAETLLMAGTGALAPYLIAAALYCLPQLKTVYVANPHHPERSAAACAAIVPQVEKLLAACGGCHAAITAAPSLETAAKQSDVILTATPAREPFLKAEWVRPGTHISCVGADMTGKQEIDSALFSAARVFGDDAAQCLSVGECEIPYKNGIFDGTSPKAKISANISKNPANEKGLDQSKCLLTVQLLLASTKPANACGVRDCGTPGVTRTRYIPLRSYNIRVVPCSTPCFKMSANPHEYRIFYRTACCRVFGSIA